jgi:hypothetical protein
MFIQAVHQLIKLNRLFKVKCKTKQKILLIKKKEIKLLFYISVTALLVIVPLETLKTLKNHSLLFITMLTLLRTLKAPTMSETELLK